MIKRSVSSHDRIPLTYAVSGSDEDKPWIALIMPFGLDVQLSKPFFDFFGQHYNVVTLESRSILDPSDRKPRKGEFSVDNHVMDLITVLDACAIDEAALVGYCSGAGIALSAVNRAPDRFTTLVLAHGEYTLLEEPACTTQFALDVDSLLSMAAQSEERARLVFEKVKSERLAGGPDVPKGIDTPFTRLRFLRRYAANYLEYKSVDYRQLARAVDHHTLLLTGNRDIQANVESSQRIKDLLRNAEIIVDPEADHYGLVRDQSKTMIAIWNFLGEKVASYA